MRIHATTCRGRSRLVFSILLSGLLASLIWASARPVDAGDRKILIVNSVNAFRDVYLAQGRDIEDYQSNLQFLQATLERFCYDAELLAIRGTEVGTRRVREGSDERWKALEESMLKQLVDHVSTGDGKIDSLDRAKLQEMVTSAIRNLRDDIDGSWPDEVPDVKLSSYAETVIDELGGVTELVYYRTARTPSSVAGLVAAATAVVRELGKVDEEALTARIVDPDVEAKSFATEKVESYVAALAAGRTPKEPPSNDQISRLIGRPAQTDAQRRKAREQEAAARARESGESVDKIFREILAEEFMEAYRAELERKGIRAFAGTVESPNGERQVRFYSHVTLRYKVRPERVVSAVSGAKDLEYEILRALVEESQGSKPIVALLDGSVPSTKPVTEPPPPGSPPGQPPLSRAAGAFQAVSQFLSNSFDVRQFGRNEIAEIAKLQTRPAFRAMIVATPQELDARSVAAIRAVIDRGVPTILCLSEHAMDVGQEGVSKGVPLGLVKTGRALDALLASWGVGLSRGIVASNNCSQIGVPQSEPGPRGFTELVPTEFAALVKGDLGDRRKRHALLTDIDTLVIPAPSGLIVDEKTAALAKLKATVLASTPAQSWVVMPTLTSPAAKNGTLTVSTHAPGSVKRKDPKKFNGFLKEARPIVVLLEQVKE